jgi:fibro-slime domain-containing protein
VFVSAVACGGDPVVHGNPDDFGGAGGTSSSGGSGGNGTGNGPSVEVDGGNEGGEGNEDPCASANPPEDCFNIEPSGPACGDGEINQDEEQCDDGNSFPGDGCSGVCVVEDYWECPDEGEPCVLTIACGDGVVDPGEVCDDGNTDDDDGCAADCYTVDPGYYCPDEDPSEPEDCVPLFECGDGKITAGESCEDDDAMPESGDGCDENCQLEPGWECKPGLACEKLPVCGNSIIEAGENCDDGQATPTSGDGCSAKCRKEPYYTCAVVGQACTSDIVCGNGVVDPTEACDDGQATPTSGDGCSADCKTIEEDFLCLTEGQPCLDLLKCGDGRIYGSEECDDGEAVPTNGDGCSASCTLEDPTTWSCKPGQKCTLKPYCGDLKVQPGETCDDGGGHSPVGNDGCSATCQVEEGWKCPAAGGACTPPPPVVCGDKKLGAGEACDDGNTADGDGCAANCKTIENGGQGWDCSRVGFLCKTVCGDGYKRGKEQCDDGNPNSNDGCSSTCKIEEGHTCVPGNPGPAEVCTGASVCGNGIKEGTEACDDGNGDWYDTCPVNNPDCACTPDCKKPLSCPAGSACSSGCGDGIVLPSDPAGTCDDGNNNDGDGCSHDCKVEAGFKCELKPTAMKLPMVLRDFIGWCPTTYTKNAADSGNSACDNDVNDSIKGHPDFEIEPDGKQIDGTVAATLDANGKPVNVFKNSPEGSFNPLTPAAGNGWTTGQDYFQWWYRDNATYNRRFNYTVTLTETPAGSNKWVYERNPFWPLDPDPPGTVDPILDSFTNLPPVKEKLQNENNNQNPPKHNYYFTSETRYWFQFKPDSNAANDPVLTFYGDDDVWVFIGGKLTVDIGGIHGQAEENVTIRDNGTLFVDTCDQTGTANGNMCAVKADYTVPDLTLENGKIYEIAVFQAERHVVGSNYQLTLQGFSLDTSVCSPQCGVDPPVVTPGEECDDGTKNGTGYGKCSTSCTLNGYCGDDEIDSPQEACDNGSNNDAYMLKADSCGPGCVLPPYCGDNTPNAPYEECDLGNGNTDDGYGGCTKACKVGPYCGDAIPDLAHGEVCDDGVNDGFYGTCNADCTPAPTCGDGFTDVIWGEECDEESDTCHECKLIACGNGSVDAALGEQCDDGDDNGAGYGYCTTECKFGPRCGDGVLQEDENEDCDDGEDNDDNAYGACTTACKFGPYCGDAKVTNPPETCDVGKNDGTYGGCFADCTPAAKCGDGVVQVAYGEQCEVGVDGATATTCKDCKLGANCGNKFVDPGEQCDDGKNDGGYGECAPGCKLGARCGDGVKNGDEQCDDGENKGGYGKCSPGCVYGPYCGDGKVNKPYEECDDKNTKNGDGCSSACKSEISVPK